MDRQSVKRSVHQSVRRAVRTASAIGCVALWMAAGTASMAESAPVEPDLEGFQQLLPRGTIPALVDPTFVAADAAEIPDDAWVLGFQRDGESFAYDLNLLNAHEVVNHGSERSRFAAVW